LSEGRVWTRTPTSVTWALLLGACTASQDLGVNPSGDAAAADAMEAFVDGGTSDGAIGDVSSAEAGGLPYNGGFEQGSGTDCAHWMGSGVTLSRDPLARSGLYACRVCAAAAQTISVGPVADLVSPLNKGSTYQLAGWIRAFPGSAQVQGIQSAIFVSDASDVLIQSRYSPTQVIPSDTWQQTSVTLTLDADGQHLSMLFVGTTVWSVGDCFLLDDASLEEL
jgi:hypothetical protein